MPPRPKIALLFRYGPGDHSELFHAMPDIVAALAEHAEVHYYGMRTATPVPETIRRHAILHGLPFRVDRTNARDKMLKTMLWLLCLPWLALHCRLQGIRVVYMDETIPLSALMVRLFFGRKVVITVADFFTDIYFTGITARLGRAIRALDVWSWRRLPLIFTRAKNTRDWLARQGVDPAASIPCMTPATSTSTARCRTPNAPPPASHSALPRMTSSSSTTASCTPTKATIGFSAPWPTSARKSPSCATSSSATAPK